MWSLLRAAIRFWRMASTFTGLKLQGAIGKFGKVELTDIVSFVELPDGKVVSTSESGALLLWEGSFIKVRGRRERVTELLMHSSYAASHRRSNSLCSVASFDQEETVATTAQSGCCYTHATRMQSFLPETMA